MKQASLVQLTLSLVVIAAKKHVIRSPKLNQTLELGEVLAEKTVESAAACGQLCAADPVCHTVVLIGQRCLLFLYLFSHCPAEVSTAPSVSLQITNIRLGFRYVPTVLLFPCYCM